MRRMFVALAAGAAFAVPASASTVYSNNFDTDNGGATALNFNGFTGLNVTDGTVDLVHTNDGYGIICAGGTGGCVDLDGSTSDSGVLSSGSYGFTPLDAVTLSFDFGGSQRDGYGVDSGRFGFAFATPTSGSYFFTATSGTSFSGSFVNSLFINYNIIPFNFPFDHLTLGFRATSAGTTSFSFADGGNNNVGPIVDNVSLDISAVPEPASWALMIAGFGLVGGAMRRRTKVNFVTA